MNRLTAEAAEAFFSQNKGGSILAKKCRCLYIAYGMKRPYLHFYQLGQRGMLVQFQDQLLLDLADASPEEAGIFLRMLPGRHCLTTSKGEGALVLPYLGETFPQEHQVFVEKGRAGDVSPQLVEDPPPRACHQLFISRFGKSLGDYDAFYCDYFYRRKKGLAKLFAWREKGQMVGALLATDIEEKSAVLSTLAVEKSWERKGVARGLLRATTARLAPRESAIISKGPEVDGLYQRLGFTPRERILTVTLGGTE